MTVSELLNIIDSHTRVYLSIGNINLENSCSYLDNILAFGTPKHLIDEKDGLNKEIFDIRIKLVTAFCNVHSEPCLFILLDEKDYYYYSNFLKGAHK